MISASGPHYPRQLELRICDAIGAGRMLEFDYDGYHRVVQPYCHGFTRKGAETLRAVQVNAESRSGGRGYGKLWTVAKMQNLRVAVETFDADDPDYNPNDTALVEIHCRVKQEQRPCGSR
jgi:hypothetical protein